MRMFWGAVMFPVLSSAGMGIFLLLIHQRTYVLGYLTETWVSMIVAAIVYGGIWYIIPEGKERLHEYLSYPFGAFKMNFASRQK